MKSFTLKRILIPVFLLAAVSLSPMSSLFAQTATITSPSSGTNVFSGVPVAITGQRSAGNTFGGNGSWNFTFASTPAAGVSYSANPVNVASGTNTATTNATFAGPGAYSVTVEIERANGTGTQNTVSAPITINAFNANLWGANGGNPISRFSVSAGTVNVGPGDVFDPFPSTGETTAALGRDASGNFYFLPNTTGNSGVVTVYAANSSGGSITNVGTLDLNGAGNGTSLGFVRLGIDQTGLGWILASGGGNLYLASFPANGTAATTITIVDASVTVSGGTAADFVNGDLAFSGGSGSGTMFALANNGSGVTTIYTMVPAGTSSTLTQKFSLVDNTNNAFSGQVNGVAFDAQGALYISCSGTDAGLYYIDPNTVNGPAGTVQCSLSQAGGTLQDLASNVWPSTSLLPIKLGTFTARKSGTNVILDWTTLNEKNNDRFEIERSEDGVNFVKAGTVSGAGTSSDINTYQFTDPVGGVSSKILFYRLRNVDIDGKAYYSKVVMVRLEGGPVKDLTVFPNPFTSGIRLVMQSSKDAEVTIRISNAAGQLVMKKIVNVQSGENVIVLSGLGALKSGLHLMEVISEDGKITQKILKN